jgi:serine/threonine protein phosphatase 1
MNSPKEEKSYFAFGDIHGSALELRALLSKLPLKEGDELIFLGDYIDRGEHSKQVIDIIIDLKNKYPHCKIVTLKGNHEKMFLDFLKDSTTAEAQSFIFNGGGATLASYSQGPESKSKSESESESEYILPKSHIQFLNSLQLYYETEKYFFVHAGLPDMSIKDLSHLDPSELENHILWIRDDFFESKFDWGKTIVHGHTTVQDIEISRNRINIDTGCAYGGKLSVLQLPEMRMYSIPKQEPIKMVVMMDGSKRKSVRYKGNIPLKIHYQKQLLNFISVDYNE